MLLLRFDTRTFLTTLDGTFGEIHYAIDAFVFQRMGESPCLPRLVAKDESYSKKL